MTMTTTRTTPTRDATAPAATTAPTTVPTATTVPTVERRFEAMASPVTLLVVDPGHGAEAALDRAEAVFRDVDQTCTRFDPASPLSRANAAPDAWHVVPSTLAQAVQEASRASHLTAGLFDPRVLEVLLAWGYRDGAPGDVVPGGVTGATRAPADDGPWRPRVVQRDGVWHLNLGGHPIDLGGIGKGLAVRWAADELAGAGSGMLVDAGGDVALAGRSPVGELWSVGVEDPSGGTEPVLVLAVTDTGCATSSTKKLRWRAGGRPVHHLVDPRTGEPGGAGLAAVTVLHPDPAWAEVLTKQLFLAGASAVRRRAEAQQVAAAWIGVDGSVGTSPALDPLVIWRRTDG
jgi:thiamine biosynthesis lipoprotein